VSASLLALLVGLELDRGFSATGALADGGSANRSRGDETDGGDESSRSCDFFLGDRSDASYACRLLSSSRHLAALATSLRSRWLASTFFPVALLFRNVVTRSAALSMTSTDDS
jgi:hypothetical protein